MRKEVEVAAPSLRVEVQPIEVMARWASRRSDCLGIAFSHATRGRADALIVLTGGVFTDNQSEIADLASKHRLPAIYWRTAFAEAGGFMAYGPKLQEQHRRAAYFVDKILKGAKPGDLPWSSQRSLNW
jgi:putative ABC transport system substrate-binding protein